jgi:hypothetical protein
LIVNERQLGSKGGQDFDSSAAEAQMAGIQAISGQAGMAACAGGLSGMPAGIGAGAPAGLCAMPDPQAMAGCGSANGMSAIDRPMLGLAMQSDSGRIDTLAALLLALLLSKAEKDRQQQTSAVLLAELAMLAALAPGGQASFFSLQLTPACAGQAYSPVAATAGGSMNAQV